LTAAAKKVATADALTGSGKGLGQALGNIYWADSGDSTINAAALDGSNPQAIVNGQDDPIGGGGEQRSPLLGQQLQQHD
jgi:hypothetical protein